MQAALTMQYAIPQEIRLNPNRDTLTLVYDAAEFALPAEYLRVLSPSAEVRGHGKGQEKLQTGKRDVLIDDLQATGNYALKIVFSDGHDSGLYDWDYLYVLAHDYQSLWQAYLAKLQAAGASREPDLSPPTKSPKQKTHGCGGGGCSH